MAPDTAPLQPSPAISGVKQEAGPLPWQDMNHEGKASAAARLQQQLWGETSALACQAHSRGS